MVSRNSTWRFTLTFVILSLFSVTIPRLHAQLSVKGGYSLSTLEITIDVRRPNSRIPVYTEFLHSYHIGVSQGMSLGKNWSLQGDILAHRGGGFLEVETLLERTKLVLWQVRVPIAIRYEVFQGFHLHIGGYMGHYFSSRYHFNGSSTDIGSQFATLEYGYVGGASYALSEKLTLEIRFNYADRGVARQDPETLLDEFIENVELVGFRDRTTDLSIKYQLR